MKTIENLLAGAAVSYGIARIGIHLLALCERKESWSRAEDGIMREIERFSYGFVLL